MDSEMSGNVKVNIKYTLKDIRDFCFTKVYGSVFRKIFLALMALMIFAGAVCMLAFFIFSPDPGFMVVFAMFSILYLLIILVIVMMPFFTSYLILRNNFKKGKAWQSLSSVEFSKEEFTVSAIDGVAFHSWNEIYKVQEMRPCILIYLSFAKYYIIPKRCLASQEQLEELRNILQSSVQKSKLKLKKYKLTKSCPDFEETENGKVNATATELIEDDCSESPELVLEYSLEKSDLLYINFMVFYTRPLGIIVSLLGAFVTCNCVMRFRKITYPDLISILSGLVFIAFIPVMLIINSHRSFNTDPSIKKLSELKVYKDFYQIDHPSGRSRVKWVDLVKIKETKAHFLLYVSPQFIHVIPKRIFEGRENDLQKLKGILNSK
ncbi:YcxB family protein [Acetivibrio cellulolyticus]|uniref:YcxB family protein n=1 Tax=Acetivibrio cellulolyticus TaxID=35830 RepID=UPI0002481B2B|nr:YcxB family protein [Acetivibrio cellulolyticus]